MPKTATRLLLVDDDRDFADAMSEMLELNGYDVDVVYSGESAIERCRHQQFDLALMDVRMAGRDGVDSFLEIRATQQDFRAVFMTGYSVPDLVERAVANGARAVVSKPLAAADLLRIIETHCSHGLVLLVDDDPDFRNSLAAALRAADYRVVVADGLGTAVQQASLFEPAVVLLDLRLPTDSGLEVHAALERLCPGVPTIVVSGWVDEEREAIDQLRARNLAGVLSKPFATSELLALLRQVRPHEAA